jgi:hypothetical protein
VSIIHKKQAQKFVLIDYSDQHNDDLQPYHCKAIPDNSAIDWQDWVKTHGRWHNTGSHFHRHQLHGSGTPELPQVPTMAPINSSGGCESSASGTQCLEFNEKVIADHLAATRVMPRGRNV